MPDSYQFTIGNHHDFAALERQVALARYFGALIAMSRYRPSHLEPSEDHPYDDRIIDAGRATNNQPVQEFAK